MKRFFMILALLFVAMGAVVAQKRPVVVIVPFDAKNVSKDEVDVISDVFLSEYTSTGKATVVDRSSFDKIKAQHKFESSDWSNTEKVAQVGKALNANQIITGQISQFGNQLVCTIKLLDVNTTEVISSTVKRVANMNVLFEQCASLSQELASKASLSVNDYKIGSKGPGGGTVFAIEGDWRWEVSEELPMNDKLFDTSRSYVSNGVFQDWDVPNEAQARLIYNNLVKSGHLLASGCMCIKNSYKTGPDMYRYYDKYSLSRGDTVYFDRNGEPMVIRLVRKFNINNTAPKEIGVGYWKGTWELSFRYGKRFERAHFQSADIDKPMEFAIAIYADRTFKATFDIASFDYITYCVQTNGGWKNSYAIAKFNRQFKTIQGTWSKRRWDEGLSGDGEEYIFRSTTGERLDFSGLVIRLNNIEKGFISISLSQYLNSVTKSIYRDNKREEKVEKIDCDNYITLSKDPELSKLF